VIFAGTGEGAALVSGNGLGEAANYDVEAVAAAMCRVADALQSGGSPDGREARAGWVQEHASLATSGQHAAAEVLSIAGSSEPADNEQNAERKP
jgi:hypothetical protein